MPVFSPVRPSGEQWRQGSAGGQPRMSNRRLPSADTGRLGAYAIIGGVALAVLLETVLLLVALVPQNVWAARDLPNGPIPHSLYPVVAGAFYVLPTLIGALCKRWPVAIALATLPAWLDLAIFAVAAAPRVGPFYLAQADHALSTVGTLELFAILGVLGWFGRTALLALLGRGEWGRA